MRTTRCFLPTLFLGLAMAPTAPACGDYANLRLLHLAREAVSADSAAATAAITALRAEGPPGLAALRETHAAALAAHAQPEAATDDNWPRLRRALDAVGAQRDCYASGLYWYTDFDQAEAAAKIAHKPILSLRLLGNLDEEFSCANSRFFRTTLYANAQVSAYLRDHFILHWKSVRPVPKLTIDFGDGRKLERTITGNSIHYILDADGRVVDALPGLYGAHEFLRGLERAAEIGRQCASLEGVEREEALRAYHQGRLAAINAEWTADLARLATPASLTLTAAPASPTAAPPSAEKASRVALTKMPVEMPILRRTQPRDRRAQAPAEADDETWAAIATLHADSVQIDPGARALIRAKNPNALVAATLTQGKRKVEDPFLRTLRNLEHSIAEDTVRNEYLLHSTIHQWLSTSAPAGNVDQLNRRVYAELFLTPDTDPWLGLVSPGVFSGLEQDGLVATTTP
jgi:hypothetical protein